MSDQKPPDFAQLFESSDAMKREEGWSRFLDEYTGLLRHVTRELGGDADTAMDRYEFVLGALRENDFRRLRQYRARGSGKFSTWLVAVTRRLCVDEHRRRYGRPQTTGSNGWRETRRNLVELIGAEIPVEELHSTSVGADAVLERSETLQALDAALAKLQPAERLLLRYRFEDGLSVPEIARVTGRGSPFPLYRELERILAALRAELSTVGVEWPGG